MPNQIDYAYRIEGGYPVIGEIECLGAKNFVIKAMLAALLSDTPSTLTNVPAIGDVDMSTEHTEQAGRTCVLIVGDPLAQRYALHGFRYGDIEEL